MKNRKKDDEAKLGGFLLGEPAVPRGLEIYCFDSTESTNTDAKNSARGAASDCVFIAKSQSGGRGRLGRSFSSAEGGLYMSLLFKREILPEDAMKITVFAAGCVCAAIERLTALEPKIKWVNDVFLGQKKLAGILCEGACDEFGKLSHAVVGIGINLQRLGDPALSETATSLSEHSLNVPSALCLASEIIKEFYRRAKMNFPAVISEYRSRCFIIGRTVRVIMPSGEYCASVLDIDKDGALIVKKENGETERLVSGEVSIRI